MGAHRYERHIGTRAVGVAAFLAMSCLAWGLPASAQASSAPSEVVTEPAEVIPGGAELRGMLNPGGLPTTYYFEYLGDGEVECLVVEENCWHTTKGAGPVAGNTQQQVPPVEVTGLRLGETYRYRLVASNADGTVQSTVATFTVGFSPVITSLEPNHGPTSGGTTVTIHGEPLENARSVHFGAVEGKILHEECDGECEIVPYRTLVVESPPHAAGTVDVTVETAQGVSVASPGDEFTYGPSGGRVPAIVEESVSRLTHHGTRATLDARINPGGLETKYEFWINYQPCLYLGCESVEWDPELRGQGSIAPGHRTVKVRAPLTGLDGDSYEYWVVASNAEGTVEGPLRDFPPS